MDIEGKIIKYELKLQQAEDANDRELILLYGNSLIELWKERNILTQGNFPNAFKIQFS